MPKFHKVTAYCTCALCCGKWADGITATGHPAVEGVTVAVDPSVWPLRSCVRLFGIGRRMATDTGSAIKGERIDLFLDSHERAKEWGVREMLVSDCGTGA